MGCDCINSYHCLSIYLRPKSIIKIQPGFQVWLSVVNNFKELMQSFKTEALFKVDNIKSFSLSTLNTTVSHEKFKSKL